MCPSRPVSGAAGPAAKCSEPSQALGPGSHTTSPATSDPSPSFASSLDADSALELRLVYPYDEEVLQDDDIFFRFLSPATSTPTSTINPWH